MSTDKQFEQQRQTWMELVLDAMPVAASCSTLDDQRIIFINRKFTEQFGYEPGDHKTVKDWIENTYVNPKHAERAGQLWAQFYENTSTEPIKFGQQELEIQCKDGSVKTVLLSGVVMPEDNWGMAIFADVTERRKQALEDDLTGLPNRRAFNGEMKKSLSRARRTEKFTGLLLIDLDGFKELNDTHGHKAGDTALEVIAERIRRSIRLEDFVARVGGDEFAVVIDTMEHSDIPVEVANRILAEIHDEPIMVDGEAAKVDLSIGIGVYPGDADNEDGLFSVADKALYRAKEKGRGRWSR